MPLHPRLPSVTTPLLHDESSPAFPVRTALLIVAALTTGFLAAHLHAAPAPGLSLGIEAPYRLVVPFEHDLLVPSEDALAEPCGTSSVIRACTVFFARRLDCECVRDEDRWRIHARAQFIPEVVLSRSAALQHERMHIDEVQHAVAEHLAWLTSMEFMSSSDCESESLEASEAFPSVMDEFQRESNRRHHPTYVPDPFKGSAGE